MKVAKTLLRRCAPSAKARIGHIELLESRRLLIGNHLGELEQTPSLLNPLAAVGALVTNDGAHCTGTLLNSDASAPQWVLTAAHCFRRLGEPATFYPGGAGYHSGDGGIRSGGDGILIPEDGIVIYPGYTPGQATETSVRDIALVHLSEPATGVASLGLFRTRVPLGQSFEMVGFGGTHNNPCEDPDVPVSEFGVKRWGKNRISDDFGLSAAVYELERNDGSFLVNGDSGGPALIRRVVEGLAGPRTIWEVLAVFSAAQVRSCILGIDDDLMTSTYAKASWIDSVAGTHPTDDRTIAGPNGEPFTGLTATSSQLLVDSQTLLSVAVGGFQDNRANPSTAADFSVSVDWGDGQNSTATILDDGLGIFRVLASHEFIAGGVYSVTLHVAQQSTGATIDTVGHAIVIDRPPHIASVDIPDAHGIAESDLLARTINELRVVISEQLVTTDANGAERNVLNRGNWQLLRNGVDITDHIVELGFESDPATRRYEVVLQISPMLSDGVYSLRLMDSVRDLGGNLLDGDQDGVMGGDFVRSFAIRVPVSLAAEFPASEPRSSYQWQSHAAMDPDGDAVVIWSSTGQDGSGEGVFGRRFDASGVSQGAEFQVNSYTSAAQLPQDVAMNASGDFVVTWISFGQDGSSWGVYARLYAADGEPRGDAFLVNQTTEKAQTLSAVAVDAEGAFVVTWTSEDQDGSGSGIYARRFAANGMPLGDEFRVNTTTLGSQLTPAIAMSPVGDFVVAWASYDPNLQKWGVFGQLYDAAGEPKADQFRLNSSPDDYGIYPSVAMDDTGNFVAAWAGPDGDSAGVFAQRFGAERNRLGAAFRVNRTTRNNQGLPQIAMDADGDFVIAWLSNNGQDGDREGIFAQRFDRSGTPTGEFQVNTFMPGTQTQPSVAMDAHGDFLVTWTSYDQQAANDPGIYAQRYRNSIIAIPGDIDGNRVVDLRDLNLVRNNFGANGGVGSTIGDTYPLDGVVNLNDLNAVRNNFGMSAGAALASTVHAMIGFSRAIDTISRSLPAASQRMLAADLLFALSGEAEAMNKHQQWNFELPPQHWTNRRTARN
ncbi:MAG: trypsin-like serine protease [Planctomycetia bacterium]|nr:trypsin-like serine protease [Planctomycetia bacterium]